MKIDNQLLSNLGVSIPGSRAEQGDGTILVSPLLIFAEEPISPMLRLVGSGGTGDTSTNIAVQVNRTNLGVGENILCTFARGLYELDMLLNSRFDWTAVGTAPHSALNLYNPSGSSANSLINHFAVIGTQVNTRKFRVLFAENGWSIRFTQGVTGVAEHYDGYASLQLTRIL